MRTRLIMAVASGGIFLVIMAGLISTKWEHKQGPFVDAPKIVSALHRFSSDQVARGLRPGQEISLQDLVRGGYLTTNDVRAFEGIEVAFTPQADDSYPEMVIARARVPDGGIYCLLSDGSVQQISKRKLEHQWGSFGGQPDAVAKQSQPGRSETNQQSGAAGSGR